MKGTRGRHGKTVASVRKACESRARRRHRLERARRPYRNQTELLGHNDTPHGVACGHRAESLSNSFEESASVRESRSCRAVEVTSWIATDLFACADIDRSSTS